MIKMADINYIPKVSELWLKMVNELAPDYKPNVDWWRKMAENLMATDAYHIIIYEFEKELFGFIDYFLYPEPSTGKIHGVGQHLFVLPEYRDTGVGGKLYKAAIKHAQKKGAEIIEFCCFHNDMKKWERKGYIPLRAIMRKAGQKCLIQ